MCSKFKSWLKLAGIFLLCLAWEVSHAAVVISGAEGGTSSVISIPQEYAGMNATFMMLSSGYGDNVYLQANFLSPSGVNLKEMKGHFDNEGGALEGFLVLTMTTKLQQGSYQINLSVTYSLSSSWHRVKSFYCIVWDAKGDDLSDLQAQLNGELDQLRNELNGTINTKTAALQSQINALQTQLNEAIAKHEADQAALLKEIETLRMQISALETDLRTRISLLEQQQAGYLAQLEVLKETHEKDIAAINEKLKALENKFNVDLAALQQSVKDLTTQITTLEREYSSSSVDVRNSIKALEEKQTELGHQFDLLEQQHLNDVSAIQSRIDAKIDLIRAEHAADVEHLENSQAVLQEKIDVAVADLRQELLTLNNAYKDSVAELKSQITATNNTLLSEVSKLSDTDRDIYDKISDLREKQADYYSRMEVLKVTHEKDKEALEKEMASLDANYKAAVESIQSRIDDILGQISDLKTKHESDVAAIRQEIESHVNSLDEDIRKIYQDLSSLKDSQAEHKEEVQKALDEVLLRLTELDKAVTERLQNLENRIKYAVYSDEKLEDLKADFEKQIQDKEKEIADVDLEIKDLTDKGLDTSSKEETRNRLLTELVKLRNELTDIEFAIEIRHNDSEFAEHEKEIELLKSELAALRQSHDLEIKQLKDDLLALEEEYLKLLEEVKQNAAGQNSELQKQLDDLKSKVLEFVETLRNEREVGDAELKALLDAMDVSHKELIGNLDSNIADKLDRLKFETDTQFENLRTTINNLAYQQRFNTGNSGTSYSLPSSQVQEVPSDTRDLRVSPDASLPAVLN